MSDHDGVIANDTGAAVRADLNLLFQALINGFSGSSAPAAPVAYQLWNDTGSGLLKQRNAANTTWLVRGSIAETTQLPKEIAGWTYANAAGDVTNDIDIAAGAGADATQAYWMRGAASTKQLDANWVVGSGQGGLDTGSIGNSDYYIWAIARSDTGVVDYLFSLSSSAPTMPANYDYKRLIGWFKRVGGAIVLFHTYETEGGGIEMNWDTPTLDINLSNTLTTTRRTDAVKVPLNFSVIAHINAPVNDGAVALVYAWIYCPDQADSSPGQVTAPINNSAQAVVGNNVGNQLRVRTSAAGLIAAKANIVTVDIYAASTIGFNWARRN
jgi:hypothetical protein